MRLRMILPLLLLCPHFCYADSATVELANESWLAFQCSYYANTMEGEGAEKARLSKLAYVWGTKYLTAANEGLVANSELLNIPREFIYPGPSIDYVLGAVSVFAMDMDGAKNHMDNLSRWAAAEYKKKNCQHL